MTDRRDNGAGDEREALFNDRRVGPLREVQLPTECITSLHGILFDFDPKIYRPTNPLFPPADDPAAFHDNIRPVLERHPLARHAEVRVSGTGLHLILWLSPAAEMHSAGDQAFWAAVVKAVQATLPIDPDMPGITALTRPVGATNSKNGAEVTRLKAGEPVNPQDVLAFLARVDSAPFREVAVALLGGERLSPCPVCGVEDTRLDVRDRSGMCYGGCGQVTLVALFDSIFVPQRANARCGGAKGKGRDDGVAPRIDS